MIFFFRINKNQKKKGQQKEAQQAGNQQSNIFLHTMHNNPVVHLTGARNDSKKPGAEVQKRHVNNPLVL